MGETSCRCCRRRGQNSLDRLDEVRDITCVGFSSGLLHSDAYGVPTQVPALAQRDGVQRDMKLEDRITITPGVRGGKPCIRGTRITVYDILEYLAGGMTESQILADFPSLTPEDIRACLVFAAARERRLAVPPAA